MHTDKAMKYDKEHKKKPSQAPTAEETAEARPEELDVQARLEEQERIAAENHDKYLRAVAEMDNVRKRAAREKADAIRYGNEALLRDILPFVDSLERAIAQAEAAQDFAAFHTGLRLIQEQLLCCLERHGVKRIASRGQAFDPQFHEAMLRVESDQHEDNEVTEEMEAGYLLNGRLLRPAKVCVCKRTRQENQPVEVGDKAEN